MVIVWKRQSTAVCDCEESLRAHFGIFWNFFRLRWQAGLITFIATILIWMMGQRYIKNNDFASNQGDLILHVYANITPSQILIYKKNEVTETFELQNINSVITPMNM